MVNKSKVKITIHFTEKSPYTDFTGGEPPTFHNDVIGWKCVGLQQLLV